MNKRRLFFLYIQHKAGKAEDKIDLSKRSYNYWGNRVTQEGYYWLIKRLKDVGIVKESFVIIESTISPGVIQYEEGLTGYVIPNISNLKNLLQPGDIIFVRGGWKSWFDPLIEFKKDGHKLICYAANTGREKWWFWDVVFNDLWGDNKIDVMGRYQFDFHKPINPTIFHYTKSAPVYDLCIGASNIHDKKGQYKTVEALIEFKKIFSENLKCILPGALRSSKNTHKLLGQVHSGELDIYMPGEVNRHALNKIYNKSKIFIHLGTGGQGDRGVIEAMSTGCKLVLGNTVRHHRVTYQDKDVCHLITEGSSPEKIARELYYLIKTYDLKHREYIVNYFKESTGVEEVIIPQMFNLFSSGILK